MAQLFRLDRALIRVSGPDAVPFLNNLLTQNLNAQIRNSTSRAMAPCSVAQGKVIADMMLWPRAEDVVLEAER